MKIEARSVDEYLGKIPANRRAEIESIRALIFQLYPDAEETIDYDMPAFRRSQRTICHIASQAHHISLYIDPEVMDLHREQLDKLNCGKSCLRFTKAEKLPEGLLKTLLIDAGKSPAS